MAELLETARTHPEVFWACFVSVMTILGFALGSASLMADLHREAAFREMVGRLILRQALEEAERRRCQRRPTRRARR